MKNNLTLVGSDTLSNEPELKSTQFTTRYDSDTSAIWCWMHPTKSRPCVSSELMEELTRLQNQLTATYNNQSADTVWPFRHLVLASKIPDVFSLGGDLELFKHCKETNDREKLRTYAYQCINLLYQNINNLDLPITMMALVQGQALGGGFETALSCDVIVAEKSAVMGFPEILFNLFPGMGAYNLLERRIGPSLAERIILSGSVYDAEELYDMGVVDVLAEDGEGEEAVERYLKSHNQSHNTIRAMKKIRQIVHPISYDNLREIVDIWVDSAMALSDKDMAKLERLLHVQENFQARQVESGKHEARKARRGDWRKVEDVQFPLITHLGENVMRDRRRSSRRQQETEE